MILDRGPWMVTASGHHFHTRNPDDETINIIDIAASLSRICRFNGHLKHTYALEDCVYSVAQHSVYVDKLLVKRNAPKKARRWALMHDAAEGYYGDLVSPVKVDFPGFSDMEDHGAEIIRDKYKIPYDKQIHDAVKHADLTMCVLEARELTEANTDLWFDSQFECLEDDIRWVDPNFFCWSPRLARRNFLKAFDEVFSE